MNTSLFKPSRRIVATLGVAVCLTPSAFAALVITPTFTAGFNTAFGANAVAAQNSWIAAANQFSTLYSDNIHININVDGVAGTSVFGQSQFGLNSISYANLHTRLVADSTTPNDVAGLAVGGSIPLVDPRSDAHTYYLSRAQAKALGYIGDDLLNDGTTTFGAGNPFTFSGPITAGTYDFQGIALHEISEVMGRLGLSGGSVGANLNTYSLIDLFAFTGPGARGMSAGPGEFHSTDNGVTLLKLWNNALLNSLDTRDWAPSSQGGTGAPDAVNQFSNSGVVNGFTPVDRQLMDSLGYDLIAVPEPTTGALLAGGLALGFCLRRFKR